MLDIQNQEKTYTLTLTPMEGNNKNKKTKRRKFLITKYILLVFIISLIVFIGTFIGYKIVQDFNLNNIEKTLIVNFIGFFNIFIFLCILFWIFIANIYSIFDFSSTNKKLTWKIIASILFLFMFALLAVAITFFILLIIEVIKAGKNYKFDDKWFDNMTNFFIENFKGSKNLNYIMLFVASLSWSILTTIYFIINKVFIRKSEERFRLIKINTDENKKNNNFEMENNTNDKHSDKNNNKIEKSENNYDTRKENNKKESISPIEEIKKENNLLTEMEENQYDYKDKKTKKNEIENENKKNDENDPYSLFK